MCEKDKQVGILCPGQGAQSLSLGNKWEGTVELDEVLEIVAEVGLDLNEVLEILYEDSRVRQQATRRAQLALWIEQALYKRHFSLQRENLQMIAGHSVGEVYALHIAGVLSEADSLRVVDVRSQAMATSARQIPGKMMAIMGTRPEVIQGEIERLGLQNLWLSIVNSNSQVVISGDLDCIEEARNYLSKIKGFRCLILPTGGAFHTPLMNSAAECLAAFLDNIEFKNPLVEMPSNTDGRCHTGNEWRRLLSSQVTSPVRWDLCMEFMHDFCDFYLELSQKRVLFNLIQSVSREQDGA